MVLGGVGGGCLGSVGCMDLRVGVAVLNDGASSLASTIEDILLTDVEDVECKILTGGLLQLGATQMDVIFGGLLGATGHELP